jgi:hypothetical protein
MTSARAKIEQAMSGQIGHPAACMIENNAYLRTNKLNRIMAHWNLRISELWRLPSTQLVDIFVENYHPSCHEAPPALPLNKTVECSAPEYQYKSKTCAGLRRSPLAVALDRPARSICVKRAPQFREVAQIE